MLSIEEYERCMEEWEQEKVKLEKHMTEDVAATEAVLSCEQEFSKTQFLLKEADSFVLETTPELNKM